MSLTVIRTLIETKLNAITPALATAWENVPFVPITGTPYQQVNMMHAIDKDMTVSDSSYVAIGLYQVTLCYPSNTGAKLAEQRADLIRSTFKRGLILTSSNIKVEINKATSVARGQTDGDRFRLPITIHYKAFISL